MTDRETDRIVEGLTPIMKIDDHLEIHPRQPEDAEELFALTDANRNHLRLWLPWLDHCTSPDDTRKNILTSLEEADHGVSLAVCIWDDGCIVGVTGFNSISKVNRIGHIGYAPRRDSLRSLRR